MSNMLKKEPSLSLSEVSIQPRYGFLKFGADSLLTYLPPSGWVMSAVFSPDGAVIISGSADNSVKEWNAATGVEVRTLGGQHALGVRSVAVVVAGPVMRVASGSDDGTIVIRSRAR